MRLRYFDQWQKVNLNLICTILWLKLLRSKYYWDVKDEASVRVFKVAIILSKADWIVLIADCILSIAGCRLFMLDCMLFTSNLKRAKSRLVACWFCKLLGLDFGSYWGLILQTTWAFCILEGQFETFPNYRNPFMQFSHSAEIILKLCQLQGLFSKFPKQQLIWKCLKLWGKTEIFKTFEGDEIFQNFRKLYEK